MSTIAEAVQNEANLTTIQTQAPTQLSDEEILKQTIGNPDIRQRYNTVIGFGY